MKKNRMMRVASTLLVAVLLTTCAVSGTFAKYVTSASGSDTARVAKWGVEVSGMKDGLFKNQYAKDSETTFENTVVSKSEVVAPGTKNDTGVTFSLTGTPEVAVEVAFGVTVNNDVFLKEGTYKDCTKDTEDTFELATAYYPVVFTLKDGENELVTGELADIKTYLEGLNMQYEAGKDLSKICEKDSITGCTGIYTLTWAWAFEGNDQADTLLGNLAAGTATGIENDKYSTEIDFSISITVTQVD